MTARWISAADILALRLPALPADKGGLSRLIAREGWRNSPLAREGEAGWEYQLGLLPAEAQAEFLAREIVAECRPPAFGHGDEAWAAFEALPETAKAAASERLAVVDQVVTLRAGGMKAGDAVLLVARRAGISTSTLWGWLKLTEAMPRAHWLAALAPRHKGRTATAECDPRAWDFLAADYLRAERPSFSACHRRMLEAAAAHGWGPIPASKTLQRRLEALPAAVRTLARQGRDAAARMYPHQTRDRSHFVAMQAVNADGHTFNVRVEFDDGAVGRPVLVGVQDLATGKLLGHRLAESESWNTVRLAFADMVEQHGIPEQCWLDNGRAFASKKLTGGMKNRFRFKIREDEPQGILTQLGIKVRWTTPYHGQSKPIERAWRDLCEEIAKHPALAGAFTGNSVADKPENYGSRAIPIAEFRRIVASEIARHNARTGRRGMGMNGESFDAAFARSLAAPGTVVTRATEAQRRLLLLAAEGVICRGPTGEVHLGRNRYWDERLSEFIGRKVTVRFDPDNLHGPVAVYAHDGRLICEAKCIDASGFDSQDAAQTNGRDKSAWLKGHRRQLELERRLGIEDVASLMPMPAPAAAHPAPVVRLFGAQPVSPAAADADRALSRAIRALAEGEDAEILNFPLQGAG